AFFHVFAVVAFVAVQAKQPFLKNGIAPVPECRRKTDALMIVRDSADAILAPAIGAGTRVIMGKIFPGCAVGAGILANGARRALAGHGSNHHHRMPAMLRRGCETPDFGLPYPRPPSLRDSPRQETRAESENGLSKPCDALEGASRIDFDVVYYAGMADADQCT